MRKVVARLAEWWKWRRIAWAERVVWRYGYGVYHREYVDRAADKVAALSEYAAHSGHLRRGFQAGKRVQRDTHAVVRLLLAAAAGNRPRGFVHIGDVVAGALTGLLVGAVVRSGTRGW